jgi:hypothetical protein
MIQRTNGQSNNKKRLSLSLQSGTESKIVHGNAKLPERNLTGTMSRHGEEHEMPNILDIQGPGRDQDQNIKVASQGSPDWNRIEEWLHNMQTLENALTTCSLL